MPRPARYVRPVAYAALKLRLVKTPGLSAAAPALLAAQRWAGRRLTASPFITILAYHRAADPTAPTEYDEGVVDVTPEAFDRQLEFLDRFCSVISLSDLHAFARDGKKLPPNPVLLTFDDGYKDNHDVVMPLLAKRGQSAVFFVATHYLEARRLFWWDRVNLLLKRSTKERLELAYPEALSLPLRTPAERAASIRAVLRVIKDRFALDLERFLEALAEAADVHLSREDERRRVDDLLMTWDEVRALRKGGMDVASHTSTHRVLQTLPPDRLAEELRTSRATLEDVLGEPVKAISYPVGKPLGRASHIKDAVRDAGYDLGFSNCSGVNHAWSFDPLDARRMPTDADTSDAHFRTVIAVPYLAT